ncbi:MAG: PilZ domain-containing protein [Micrococcales bacterium]|nr:PilZ domain-containing protein [Micrococcales bacterium]MCL2667583.1 PilZ domain-containing protein [Micrococcales bacterium]
MYELARCVLTGGGATFTGYVDHFDSAVLAVRFAGPVEGLDVADGVEIRVLDDVRGEVHFGASLAGVDTTDDATVVYLASLREIGVRQRRAAARVRVSVPLTGTVTRGDPPVAVPVKLTVLDVSASGAKLLVADRLPLDATVAFAFPVGDDVVDLVGEVVWSEESASGWRMGCRFVGIDAKDTELLFRYVLLTQGAQLRRARASGLGDQ